jgi:hypothetical protein
MKINSRISPNSTKRKILIRMHPYVLIVISLFVWHTSLSGQQFRGGLKGGMVASEVSGDNLSGPNKIGFYGAAFANYPFSGNESLQMEVMYIQKGSRAWPEEANQYFDYRFALQYVEVPVLFVQNLSRFTSLNYLNNILVHGGLSASFLVDSQETENGFSIPDERRDNFYGAELNLIMGFSYPLTEMIFFNFAYSNSLTPVRPHSTGQTTWNNYGQYNSVWKIGLSVVAW